MLSRTTFGASSGFSRTSTFTPTGPRRTSLTRGSPRSRNRMCWLRFWRCFSQAGGARGAGGGVAGRWAGAAARRAAGRRAGRLARSRASAAGSLSAAGVCWLGFCSLRRAAACEARWRARSRRLSLAAASRLVGGLVRDVCEERRGGRLTFLRPWWPRRGRLWWTRGLRRALRFRGLRRRRSWCRQCARGRLSGSAVRAREQWGQLGMEGLRC